jgi:hypothetical protein
MYVLKSETRARGKIFVDGITNLCYWPSVGTHAKDKPSSFAILLLLRWSTRRQCKKRTRVTARSVIFE